MKGWLVAVVCMLSLESYASGTVRDAEVLFDAIGPAGFKLQGKTSELKVEETGELLTVRVPLAKLDTGIELRNKHMREKYLETSKFPEAQLTVKKADVPLNGRGEAAGTLKVHGVEKPVKFKYVAQNDGKAVKVEGGLKMNFKDFGIDVPSYLGVTVKPDIDVSVRFSVQD